MTCRACSSWPTPQSTDSIAVVSEAISTLPNVLYIFSRIRGSHGGEYEDTCLLGFSAVYPGGTLVNFYQTTRRYNPEDSHLPFIYLFIFTVESVAMSALSINPFPD
jgi:hypothetical protein